MEENKKTLKSLDVQYPMDNEFEMVKGVVTQYMYMEKSFGRITSLPSDKLMAALVFYVMKGYSYETKEKVRKYLQYSNMRDVDQINLKLKQLGFLVDDVMSKKNKKLNQSLQEIARYVNNNTGGKLVVRSIIYLQHGADIE
jgi:hypothetical protein